VPTTAGPLVCERCGLSDESVVLRSIGRDVSVPLCGQCDEVRRGLNEPSERLGWLLWVLIATLVLFAVGVGVVVIALD
jgi:hypothetical protein